MAAAAGVRSLTKRACKWPAFKRSFSCSPGFAALNIPPREGVDWDGMGFGLNTKETQMLVQRHDGQVWSEAEVTKYDTISLEPSAVALNYGQSLFEGMKATRNLAGEIVVFRPTANCERLRSGSLRYALEPMPEGMFMDSLDSFIRANAEWVPPQGKGALYIRPMIFGCGGQLGVGPSVSATFLIYGSPVGGYFKRGPGGGVVPIKLRVADDHDRAAPRGVGSTKAAGNYAPCFTVQASAKADGFDDVLYLDAAERKHVEEVAASNFFLVTKEGTVQTPALGTILPGITRRSVIELLQDELGMEVVEGKVEIQTAMENAREAFCVGTGASVSPIGAITHGSETAEYLYEGDSGYGPVAGKVLDLLSGIQTGRLEDERGWVHRVAV